MLTEEQKQAIASRLGTEQAEPVPETKDETVSTDSKEETQPDADDKETQPPPRADKVESKDAGKEEETRKPRDDEYVPVDKHIRIRRERNALRDELQAARERLAEMEGFIKASARGGSQRQAQSERSEPDWLDKLLGEVESESKAADTKPDPREDRLNKLESYVQDQEAKEGKMLLGQVVDACQKHDPSIPRGFLVDKFAEGKTPEQALKEWQTWTAPLRQPNQGNVQNAKSEVRAPPAPPPTVNRSPQGPSKSTPTEWRDVASAVRRAINGR